MAEVHAKPSSYRFQDLTGKSFGLWTVHDYAGKDRFGLSLWTCSCSCTPDRMIVVIGSSLKRGKSLDCGCRRLKRKVEWNTTHGKSNTEEHSIWMGMIQRCVNPNQPAYKYYGGRGIRVCERWLGDNGFVYFLQDMGPRPSRSHSVERKNNNKGYGPDNCIWALPVVQGRNNRRNHIITAFGKSQCVSAWEEEYKCTRGVISYRINHGWSAEEAITGRVRVATGRVVIFKGQQRRVPDLAREFGIAYHTLIRRLDRGWSVEDAVTMPLKQ